MISHEKLVAVLLIIDVFHCDVLHYKYILLLNDTACHLKTTLYKTLGITEYCKMEVNFGLIFYLLRIF